MTSYLVTIATDSHHTLSKCNLEPRDMRTATGNGRCTHKKIIRRGKGRERGEVISDRGTRGEVGGRACYRAIVSAVSYFCQANAKILIGHK